MNCKNQKTEKSGTWKCRALALLLCITTLIASLLFQSAPTVAEAAEGEFKIQYAGKDIESITLPQDDKRTLYVEEKVDTAYSWQLCVNKSNDEWVTVSGQKKNFITLSYAMVKNLLDNRGTTYVRSIMKNNGNTGISTPVCITVSYTAPETAEQSETATAPRKSSMKRANAVSYDLKSYTVTINYIYENGDRVSDPYVANIEADGEFVTTVKFPSVVGYLPYFQDDENSSTEYTINIPKIAQDYTYTVIYKPTLVSYKVHHYIQNILDDNYVWNSTTYRTGLTGTSVGENCAIDIEGFTALYYDKDTKIAADGSTEIEIYYDRNYYLISFDLNKGYGVDPIYTRYGATVSVGKPTRPGYVFDSWELIECGGETATNEQKNQYNLNLNSVTVPYMNLKYQAVWKTSDTTYTVVYWTENADDDGYSYESSRTVKAKSGTTVNGSTYGTTRSITHFTYNADKTDKNVIVEGDSSTVVNVYYSRNRYTLTFRELTCTDTSWLHTHKDTCYAQSSMTITAKYGADIHNNFPIKGGNKTIWWEVPNGTETFKTGNYLGSIDTMPGENITFKEYDRESGAVLYYYTETLSGVPGDTVYKGKNYNLYKKIDLDLSGELTYKEEFHNIKGFEQGDSKPTLPVNGSVTTWRNNYLYYTRKSYSLKFFNYKALVKEKEQTVQYQQPLKGFDFTPDYPDSLEPNAYEFAGWFTTPDCYDGSQVDFSAATMPDSDVTLYAKWAPKTHTVRIFKTADKTEDELIAEQLIPHGSYAKAPVDIPNGNYVFNGWFYMDGTEKKAFDFNNMPVNRDLDIFAEWSSNTPVLYTVRYELEDGTEIAAPTVGSTLAGTSKTFTAKGGTELYDKYQDGYFPNTNSHTILMNINGGNEYTFIYKPIDNVPYTVKYLEKGTGKLLHSEKYVAENKKSVVTEKFEQINGYMPDAYQKRLVLSADGEENVLTFWYTKDDEHAYYIIRHLVQNLEGDGYTEYRTIQGPGKIGETITEKPLLITGYTYNEGKGKASGKLTKDGLELVLYYDRNLYSYTVKYLKSGTGKELHNEKQSDQNYRYGKVVSEDAIDIPGYKLIGDKTKTRTIRENNNEIIFYYSEQQVTVKYIPVPAGCGTVSISSEIIKAATGEASGSAPTPAKGYRFDGWFTDEDCTKPVSPEWIDTNGKLTPKKENGLYAQAVYYAKFSESTSFITIQKSGWNPADENQTFLFGIKGTDENTKAVDLTVTVHGNGKTTITDLPVGQYTVTEKTDWSWRYAPEQQEQSVEITVEGKILEFKNKRTEDKWLDGDNYSINHFGTNR